MRKQPGCIYIYIYIYRHIDINIQVMNIIAQPSVALLIPVFQIKVHLKQSVAPSYVSGCDTISPVKPKIVGYSQNSVHLMRTDFELICPNSFPFV
jgi:hypothetical protein